MDNPGNRTMLPDHRPPTRPDDMVLEEFLKPLEMTQTELARRLHVSFPRINEIINGRRGITPDTALRLSRRFGTTPEFRLNGQRNWDLWHALHSESATELDRIEPVSVQGRDRLLPATPLRPMPRPTPQASVPGSPNASNSSPEKVMISVICPSSTRRTSIASGRATVSPSRRR
jgi:antitoxin HigA-1